MLNEDQKLEYLKQMFYLTGIVHCAKAEQVELATSATNKELYAYADKFDEIIDEMGEAFWYAAMLEAFEDSRAKLALLHSI